MRCAFSWITCPAPAHPCHTGGDIACAVAAPGAVRLLVGDVMGHGERAARTAAEVTRAFRELARHAGPLQEVAMRLHAFVAARDDGEEFVTALLISVPMSHDGDAEIICCGHPQPLLLRGGQATPLDALAPSPPLGLLDLAGTPARAGLLGAGPGDGVLLYTDGVTDARDAAGRPYPLAERAAALSGSGRPLLEVLRADLLDHAGARLRDDATLFHLRLSGASDRRSGGRGPGTRASTATRSARCQSSPRADAPSRLARHETVTCVGHQPPAPVG
jgi:serine phosphatase RsbU (regulator of sigma subunit)